MSATDRQRLALHAAARTTLGVEEGDTLMASLPPANAEIATRQDLARLEGSLGQDMEDLEESLRKDMQHLEQSLRKDMQHLEERLHGVMATSIKDACADLTKRIHASELRTIGVVLLAAVGNWMFG